MPILIALLLGILVGPASAQEKGIQTSPDEGLMFVSKDVGDERWAIALDTRTGIATGNVFPKSGGAPSFVWCQATSVTLDADPLKTNYTFDCFGASPCKALPCGGTQWSFIRTVSLLGSFFSSP